MANKKLHLLKPDLQRGYLDNGKGQQVTFLNIKPEWDEEVLKEDIQAGAVQFKPVLEMVKKNPSRFVLIETESEEQGYLAVSYLAGIYNKRDGAVEDDTEPFDFTEADESDCFNGPYTEPMYIGEEEPFNDFMWDDSRCVYKESGNRLPVISMEDLKSYTEVKNNQMHSNIGAFPIMYSQSNIQIPPYWLSCTKEPVCIVIKDGVFIGEHDVQLLDKFSENRHVYILFVSRILNEEVQKKWDDGPFVPDFTGEESFICNVMLEYTARAVKIILDKEKMNQYYNNLFDSWLDAYQLKTEKGFPKARIIKRILSMNRMDKSQLMEKVLLYAIKDGVKGNCLTGKDFEMLDFFNVLSKEEKSDKKAVLRMERDLIGMEGVKQQVRDIISLMKYNKMREKMGIKHGKFHNIHMLIGAPGTAKTTVAEIMGNMMMEEKLLAGNRFISINGADLKGMYVGHSAPKTKAIFDENDIIFIDEAYSIAAGGQNGMDIFSEEAIAQLIIEMEKHAMDRLVIFAGYGGPEVSGRDNMMNEFLNANPGIRSRINSTIYFKSYTPEEMVLITHRQAENMSYELDSMADRAILEYFRGRVEKSDFGNGREARSLVEQCSMFTARRVMALPERKITKKMMREICQEDVLAAIEKQKSSCAIQEGKRITCGFFQ